MKVRKKFKKKVKKNENRFTRLTRLSLFVVAKMCFSRGSGVLFVTN